MCVAERKIYLRPDGRRETIETIHRCHRASGSRLCSRIEHRTTGQMPIVERRSTSSRERSDPIIVTQGRDGRENVYRDVTSRLTRLTPTRRGNPSSNRSSIESPSTASSSSYVRVRPEAPSPPLLAPRITILEPSQRALVADEPARSIRSDGTAVYEQPPPLDLPRAMENERRPRSEPSRNSSISRTTAKLDKAIPMRRRRRPSISVDTSGRLSTPSAPSTSSPGLSQLPPLRDLRHDSGRDLPTSRSRDNAGDTAARQQAENERQAQIEQGRLAESQRRQQARRNAELNTVSPARAASDSSRERHIRATAAALEGKSQAQNRAQVLQAELEHLARERATAEVQKRESDQSIHYVDERPL